MSTDIDPKLKPDYYRLQPVTKQRGEISSAAFIFCGLCGGMISGMGGPGHGSICTQCADALREGKLQGCVDWTDSTAQEAGA